MSLTILNIIVDESWDFSYLFEPYIHDDLTSNYIVINVWYGITQLLHDTFIYDIMSVPTSVYSCYSVNTITLWYSCHELCSFLLTETQWIYRNLIGQETKPGHITDIAQGHDKQEIRVMCELV